MSLVILPRQLVVDINGTPRVGAKLSVFDAGTSTPRPTYPTAADAAAETNPQTQPITSNSSGQFAPIFVVEDDGPIKIAITDADDVALPGYPVDNIPVLPFDQDAIGRILYPRTPAEISAGVTPTDYAYPEYDTHRYGATGNGSTDDSGAFADADGVGLISLKPGKTYYLGNSDLEISSPVIGQDPGNPSIVKGRLKGVGTRFVARNVKFIADDAWTSVNDNSVVKYAEDDGVLDIEHCVFDGVAILTSDDGVLERASVKNCIFEGEANSDTLNAIALAAARTIQITGNTFKGKFYRDVKLTNAPGSAGTELEAAFANDAVTITGNHFIGSRFASSEIKQAIDGFTSARKLIVAHNTFALTTAVEYWVDLKDQGAESSAISAQHEEVIIVDNVCVGEVDQGGLRVVGAYGQVHEGNRQKAIISRNILRATNTDAGDDLLKSSRFHNILISDNIVEQSDKSRACIEVRGASRARVSGNIVDGLINIIPDTTAGAGTCLTSHMAIEDNQQAVDTTVSYGIACAGLEPSASGAHLLIRGNAINHFGGGFQAIRINALGAGWTTTIVEGNSCSSDTLAIIFSSTQADRTISRNNSWQREPNTRNGAGSINEFNRQTEIVHIITGAGAAAVTLVDGQEGQDLTLVMITDGGGDATVTPDNLLNGTTITFNDVGDSAYLRFTNSQWVFMGGTATLA